MLIAPEDNGNTVGQIPAFVWDNGEVIGQENFALLVCKDPDLNTDCWSISGGKTSGIVSHKFLAPLSPGTQYFWGVKTICGEEWGPVSEGRGFTTAPLPLKLSVGWNLIGLTGNKPRTIAEIVASQEGVISIWKWGEGGWQVALPGEQVPGDYATAKGFGTATSIGPGEGAWVNVGD